MGWWDGSQWVCWTVGKWSVISWSVVGGLVVGGFNKTQEILFPSTPERIRFIKYYIKHLSTSE